MKKKEYILILIIGISLYILFALPEIVVFKEPCLLGTFLITFLNPLFHCGYFNTWVPRVNRSVLVVAPRTKWKQCVLSESIAVTAQFFSLALSAFFFTDGIDKNFLLGCYSLSVLFYIYSNVVPEYSVKRSTVRTVVADVVFWVIVIGGILSSNLPDSVYGIFRYFTIGLCFSVYIAWFVSLFIGYRCHVKALEYKD